MKIFCIGKNYADHAAEMKSEVPTTPLVFMKPSTALLKDKQPFYHPSFSNEIHHEIELVLKFGKNGKSIQPQFVLGYIESYTLGLDFTARDLQQSCKEKGYPWEIAKSFDHSAVIGDWMPFENQKFMDSSFFLNVNGIRKQAGHPKELIFGLEKLIEYISSIFTIQKGDLLFTGTPSGVGPVKIGDKLEGYLDDIKVLHCDIK